jgi:hypothetical protein
MDLMFANMALSTANYDALLIAWAQRDVPDGIPFDAGNSKYSAGSAAAARQSLIDDDGWEIADGGQVD